MIAVAVRLFRWYRVRANHKVGKMAAPNISKPSGYRHPELEVIFSSRDGYVWVSWHAGAVKLGPHEVVADMMRDFLAQDALGKRLAATRVVIGR